MTASGAGWRPGAARVRGRVRGAQWRSACGSGALGARRMVPWGCGIHGLAVAFFFSEEFSGGVEAWLGWRIAWAFR